MAFLFTVQVALASCGIKCIRRCWVVLVFSSGFVDIKYHKNIIVRALIKISLLDSLLFIIFSLSLFINMLFWLEEWQRTRQPLKKDE